MKRAAPRRGTQALALGLAAQLIFLGCSPESSDGESRGSDEPWFEEVSVEAGISFVHSTGATGEFWFPEIACGGAALLDFDGDGALDLYFVNAGGWDDSDEKTPGNALYRNVGEATFHDVTEEAGVGHRGYGMGATCADYDGDGDVDLYVTNVGPNVLYANDNDGSFTDASSSSGTADESWGTSCAFLDYDRDGDLDLFLTNYVLWTKERDRPCTSDSGEREYCGPTSFGAPAPDTLFRNDGDGRFSDQSDASGIRSEYGNGLGVACLDYDSDGWLDIYVANDGTANQLWHNLAEGRFDNAALTSGSAVNGSGQAEAGMGVQAVDIDQDGIEDLFLSHLRHETNTFYRGRDDWFEDATAAFGLGKASYAFTGFGLGLADFDHDGVSDLYVANGRVSRWDPVFAEDLYAEPNQLYAGKADSRFEEREPTGGTRQELVHTSRAAAFGDLDNDGDLDIVVVNRDGPPYLLRNVAASGNWFSARVLDRVGRHALFARVTVSAGGRTLTRRVQRAYSYLASNDPRAHFGLADAVEAETVEVLWTDGSREAFGPLPVNEHHELRQGEGRAL